jgi:hypothetical protein
LPRHYSFLSFQSGVDWRDVSSKLLINLNRLGMGLHKVITVTSGYRTVAEQAALYEKYKNSGFDNRYIAAKPGQSMHNQGLAVDAVIDGRALSSVVSSRTLKKYGLVAPVAGDPVHIQLYGSKNGGGTAKTSSPPSQAAPPDQSVSAAPSITNIQPQGNMPTPDSTIAPVYAPGTVPADASPQQHQETWQLLASQPLASPETQALARRLTPSG